MGRQTTCLWDLENPGPIEMPQPTEPPSVWTFDPETCAITMTWEPHVVGGLGGYQIDGFYTTPDGQGYGTILAGSEDPGPIPQRCGVYRYVTWRVREG